MEIRDLQETADLAHLNLSQEELEGAFPAFEEMLTFFAAMQAADRDEAAFSGSIKSRAEGMAASSRLVNAACFRQDSVNTGNPDLSEKMLEKAGERDGRFLVIPNVL
jgi:aspartyl-tRNA(Asn)/glutamyl-tRNA(Gln) amidotransferase subunit C